MAHERDRSTNASPPRTEKPVWHAPRLIQHGSIRELTRGNASGSMADNMFGGAVGSGMM